MLSGPRLVKRLRRVQPAWGLGVAEHIEGDALVDLFTSADTIDGLLHLTVASIAPFDGVGGCRQQGIIQEGQRLVQGGREQLVERLTKGPEAADPLAKSCQLGLGCVGSTAPVEQTVSLIDNLSERSQAGLPPGNSPEGLALPWSQVALDEQMTVIKQIGNLGRDASLAGGQFAVGPRRSSATELGKRRLQLTANRGHGLEDGLVQLGDDVKLADLMACRREHLGDGRGIQR